MGDETRIIRDQAPRTWAYLTNHADKLDRRKSSIYKNKPRFSIFGIGDYSFAQWKVAISGLYKKIQFSIIPPLDGKPAMVDDTCYFLPCTNRDEAILFADLLNSKAAHEFLHAFIFWDAKRPITADILKRLDLIALAKTLHKDQHLARYMPQSDVSESQFVLFSDVMQYSKPLQKAHNPRLSIPPSELSDKRPRLIFPYAYTIFYRLEYLYLYKAILRGLKVRTSHSHSNQKGGVGKTLPQSTYLRVWLLPKRNPAARHNPQANASSGCGIVIDEHTPCVYEVLLEDVPLMEVIHESDLPFLSIAPSHIRLTGAEVEMVSVTSREQRLKNALLKARETYDFIIIDCPPALGLLTLNALTAADSVLIPIQCEFYALEGLSKLLNTLHLVQQHLNPHLAIEGVLLTMYDGRLNLARQVAEETKSHFGDRVYNTIITRNVKLGEAPSFGKPIILYDIISTGAQNYMNLAGEVING